MKRPLAVIVAALLLLPALPPVRAAGAKEIWDADRTISSDLALPSGTGLGIAPGVNVSFLPGTNGSTDFPLDLVVGGSFDVCGTAGRPVRFTAPYYFSVSYGMAAACVTVGGGELPVRLGLRYGIFQNLILFLNSTEGELQNCTFDNCNIYALESPVAFRNCTFLSSSLSVVNSLPVNETTVSGCRFNGSVTLNGTIQDRSDFGATGLAVFGHARVSECSFSGYYFGLTSYSGLPVVSGCQFRDCDIGIYLRTTDTRDTPLVEDTTVEFCDELGVWAQGNLLLRNGTLRDCFYGLYLDGDWHEARPNWTILGCRLYGNWNGIHATVTDPVLEGTVFDDGAGRTNEVGRLEKMASIRVEVAGPGNAYIAPYWINTTDVNGNPDNVTSSLRVNYIERLEYVLDNSGQRRDSFPMKLLVDYRGISCETVLLAGMDKISFLLPILADLVPVGIVLNPAVPRAGQYLSITALVNNTGGIPSTRVLALFLIDGRKLDQAELFAIGPRSSSTVRAVDWKAKQGAHTIAVRVDPSDELGENEEANNNLTFNFTVFAAPEKASGPVNYPLLGLVSILLAACALGYLFARRRKRNREA